MAAAVTLLALVVVALGVALAAWRVSGWADVSTWPAEPDGPARPGALAPVRRAARPAIVLVHGICGFDAIGVGPVRVPYFRRVAARLVADGHDVAIARLPPLGGVPARAAELARLIDALPHDRVTLVAHSMGGLDARWALADPRLAARVDALVTIGTPHRGTPIADLLARGPGDRLRAAIARLGLPSEAVEWLTTWRLAAFNDEVVDAPGVRYASVVGATTRRARVHPLLRAPHAYLARVAGPSDGLVPATSQAWGEVVAEEELDHWAQIGWSIGWQRHDPAALVARALARAVGEAPALHPSADRWLDRASDDAETPPAAPTGTPWRRVARERTLTASGSC